VKRKNLGYIRLKSRLTSVETFGKFGRRRSSGCDGKSSRGFISIRPGHAVGQGSSEGGDRDMSEHESGSQRGEVQTATRSGRKSLRLSRFLLDRDKENESNGHSQALSERRKAALEALDDGWCQDKRTKSGNNVLISIGEGKNTSSPPSSLSRDLTAKPNISRPGQLFAPSFSIYFRSRQARFET
jgi:hypothetical protein